MKPPSIYCDEDVHGAVWRGLKRLSIDATSVAIEGRLGLNDEAQIAWAIASGRVILTHNVEDFPRMHAEILERGERHAGIIVGRQDMSVGEIIRRVAHLCTTLTADDMLDRLEYLSGW